MKLNRSRNPLFLQNQNREVMRKTLIKIFTAALVLAVLMAFAFPVETKEKAFLATDSTTSCSIPNTSFKDGEEIVYKLYYNWNFVWFSAGEVVFRVRDLGTMYHLSAHGSTYKSYEWFYKVRDKYDTYIDKKTLLPIVSIRDIQEGKYTLYDKISFDHQNNVATSLRGKTRQKAEETRYEIDDCMHDIISIIYYTRNLDFNGMQTGDEIPIKIFIDKEIWPLKVRYKGKEADKRIRGQGRFNTVKFSPEVIEGYIFTKDTQMIVWASDDQNKIPLMIESPISVGSVKAVLKSYKGLRYDLSAKVGDDDGDD